MARIVQLRLVPTVELGRAMPHRYCIGLFNDEDVQAAMEIAQINGGIPYMMDGMLFRGQEYMQEPLKGIVVLAYHEEGYLFSTCMDLGLRPLCNTIDSYSQMIMAVNKKRAKQGLKKTRFVSPRYWMLRPRYARRGNIVPGIAG